MAGEYRVVASNYGHGDTAREQGEVFEPTDAELQAFSDKLEPVEEDVDESAPDGDGGADIPADLALGSIP